MVAVRAKVGSRGFIRQKVLPKGKKTFRIDFSIPARDGIFTSDIMHRFMHYFRDNMKLNGRKGALGNKVYVRLQKWSLAVTTPVMYRKKYFKYLTKKFLKKKEFRDFLRIVARGKETYQLKYFNIQDDAPEE